MSEQSRGSSCPDPDLTLAILLLSVVFWRGFPTNNWIAFLSFELFFLPLAGVLYFWTKSPYAIAFSVGITALLLQRAAISTLHAITGLWWLDLDHRGVHFILGGVTAVLAIAFWQQAMNWAVSMRSKNDGLAPQP